MDGTELTLVDAATRRLGPGLPPIRVRPYGDEKHHCPAIVHTYVDGAGSCNGRTAFLLRAADRQVSLIVEALLNYLPT